MFKKIILSTAIFLVFFGASSSRAEQTYEKRAYEIVATLRQINGLIGWTDNDPALWPQTPSGVTESFEPQSLGLRASVMWSDERPKRLLSINLKNMGLGRVADFSGLSALRRLELDKNALRGINIDGDHELLRLTAAHNRISDIRLNAAQKLITLNLSNNNISTIDLSPAPGLKSLSLSGNPIISIQLDSLPSLSALELNNCLLHEIDLTGNSGLVSLSASSNKLKTLDLKHNHSLETLTARDNKLSGLDLSGNTKIKDLILSKNEISHLDLSKTLELEKLHLDDNLITAIDLSRNHMIKSISLSGNPLSTLELDGNQLMQLEQLDFDSCRLPLSQLAPLSGKARKRARFGNQHNAVFENKKIFMENVNGEDVAFLDLSSEAEIKSSPSRFIVRTDKKRNVKPSDYVVKGGVITFKKPGFYIIEMTNEEVYSHQKAHNSNQLHRIKTKVFTGVLEVGFKE